VQCGARVCSTPADISGKTLLTAFFSLSFFLLLLFLLFLLLLFFLFLFYFS